MTLMTNFDSHACAGKASLQALLNCYLREIDEGNLFVSQTDGCQGGFLELDLGHMAARLRVQIDYFSLTGPHRFGWVFVQNADTADWQAITPSQVIIMLVQECFARTQSANPANLPEFMRRIFNSYDQIEKLCRVMPDQTARQQFLVAEQALLFGHWLHPTPKSREGMTDWHQPSYAPETGGKFALRFFAVDRRLIQEGSARHPIQDIIQDIPNLDALPDVHAHEALIPMHPLQADALLLDEDIAELIRTGQLRDLGQHGPKFAATSSIRTVFSRNCPWMMKFSLPVQITNSKRVTLHHELEIGVIMARLFAAIKFEGMHPEFQIIDDPAFITLRLPNRQESGFEVIFRENPFMHEHGDGIVNLAALTADPLPDQLAMLTDIIMQLAQRKNAPIPEIALDWFDRYLKVVLIPMLDLYERHGIALEAHQQNSLLDVATGWPQRYFFRDNQGYYIAQDHLAQLSEREPSLNRLSSVCFPRYEVNERLGYYLFINQIFSVISRMGRDELRNENDLLVHLVNVLSDRLTQYSGAAADFINYMLNAPTLASKANLLTRVHDVDELQAVNEKAEYVQLPNPLSRIKAAQDRKVSQEKEVAHVAA